jgi:curved DNA-binding protein CbpA
VADRMTWYEILGIVPGATSETVRRAYLDRTRQLEQTQAAGAPSQVIEAAVRGRKALDAAWLILGYPAERERYDEEIGAGRRGTGLVRHEPTPTRPGLEPADALAAAGSLYSGDLPKGLGALADWLGPAPPKPRRRSRMVTVPDVRGLFFGPCRDALTKAGFRTSTVRLTDQPMPVEGLVVAQSPAPGETVPRSSTLTVHVWHPPRPEPRER